MKKQLFFTLLGLLSTICTTRAGQTDYTSLAAGFHTPPDSVQTSVYWYWLSGQVSVEGVERDLEAMKRAGINRAFIGQIGMGEMRTPYQSLELFTDAWWRVLHAALKKATELNIEIGIFNCPGWSQAGGPWIRPEASMRYLDRVEARVTGGSRIRVELQRPDSLFQDVRTIAFPAPNSRGRTLSNGNTRITATGLLQDPARLLDDNPATDACFDGSSEAILDLVSDSSITLRSITIVPAHRPIRAECELFIREPQGYRSLRTFDIDRSNPSIEVGFMSYAPVSISVAPVRSREFRLVIRHAGRDTGFSEVRFSETPRVERYAEKSLAKMFQSPLPFWQEYMWPKQAEPDDPSQVVQPGQVLDISACRHGDRLEWEAPAGEWIIQRLGMRPTGMQNGPAAPEGTGLEVDKLTETWLEEHFDGFIGAILERIPAADRKTFRVIVADSYEKGSQNFTDAFLEEFKARYGYDPLPWLPVYSGTVVGSQECSDRFLWDVRRFVADRLAHAHIGGMREMAHRHGLTLWLENYGHWGFPGEFLQYGGQSDEVSGEFWSEGTLGDIENRAAASCAHIYGKRRVSAESFTAAGNDYLRHPAMLKRRGDRFFAEGINNTLLHVWISQPGEETPGLNAWFGTEFNRHNAWFPYMDLFTDYLKRCNYMLQQGLNVADVAYFIGEDAPKMTGMTDPPLPAGYQFDYINAETILERMSIRNGLWTLPHGTQYRILVLPPLRTMRPELLSRLADLVREGGILLGMAPERSPSLEGYPAADRKVRELAASLWKGVDGRTCKAVRHGRGMVLSGMNLEEALRVAACPPDCRIDPSVPVLFGHRDAGALQIYFLTNQAEERIRFSAGFRASGYTPEWWDPVSGLRFPLPEYTDNGTHTWIPIMLEPAQSGFVVFRPTTRSSVRRRGRNFPEPAKTRRLENPWTLTFDTSRRGPQHPVVLDTLGDLSRSDQDSIRYYSGPIRYETTFDLDSRPRGKRIFLHTGAPGVMAKVHVNDRYAGGIWAAPYRIDVTDLLRKGQNRLTIEVVTTWVNRLIGDSLLPAGKRGTWTVSNPWNPDSPLQPSGLLQPVTLEIYEP